jgi:hypothetical protein
MQTQISGRKAVNGAEVGTMQGDDKGAEAPVFVVNFGLSWRQILAGGTIIAGLLGGAGFTGWLVLPSDMRKVEGQVETVQQTVTALKTTIKDMDDTQGQVIDVLLELRDQVARLVPFGPTPPALIPEPPAELKAPPLPRRRLVRRSLRD